MDGLRAMRFGHGEGAVEARQLLAAKYQSSTMQRYVNAWEAFERFCLRNGLRALPAEPSTIVRYMGSYLAAGAVQPDTLYGYLAAVKAVHRVAVHPSPTDDADVADARVGFRRLHVQVAGALPEQRGPLPPEVVLDFAHLGLSTTDATIQRECAGVVLGYLMCNRPGAAANLRARDLHLTGAGFRVQIPVYKMGVLKRGERVAFLIPTDPAGWEVDAPLRLVRRVWARHMRAGYPAAAHLFAAPGLQAFNSLPTRVVTTWLRRLLARTRHQPPLGTKWTGHSVRSGAASAAHAVGLRVGLIVQLMGLSSAETAFKHYINAQLPDSPAARALFARYFPRAEHAC